MTIKIRASIYSNHPATRFQVGDLVSCDWNCAGKITVHRIVEKEVDCVGCQTGVLFRVEPPMPRGSSKSPWIDAAWFWVDGLEVL